MAPNNVTLLNDMISCIKNNDIFHLKTIMEDDDTYLTDKICTKLLVECLEQNRISIANYIVKYEFDLDSEIFENYIEQNSPFTDKQIRNLNNLLSKFFICCLVNN